MRAWIAAAVAAYFLYFFQLTGMGMVGPDEPRYAWVSRAMALSGDWVTPRLWGKPWFEKPALLYWMTAAGVRAGLGEDWAPRLPVACLGVAFLLFFYRRMHAEFGQDAARYAVVVLGTSAGWVAYSHAAVFDLPLTAALGAAMLSLLGWVERGDRRALPVFAALLGVSALAKGLVGPALAGLTLAFWAARFRTWSIVELVRPVPALAFLAVALPWYGFCYASNGTAFVEEFFWRHHFARYASGALEHNQPIWFFVPVLAVGLLPWTPLCAALGRPAGRREWFLAAWAGVTLAFFSLSGDKLPQYVLPAAPAVAALAGIALARRERPMRGELCVCALTLGLIPMAAALLPQALGSGLGEALDRAGSGRASRGAESFGAPGGARLATPASTTPFATPSNVTPLDTPGDATPLAAPASTIPLAGPGHATPLDAAGSATLLATPASTTPLATQGNAAPLDTPGSATLLAAPVRITLLATPGTATLLDTPGGATPLATSASTTPLATQGNAAPLDTPGSATLLATPASTTPLATPGTATLLAAPGRATLLSAPRRAPSLATPGSATPLATLGGAKPLAAGMVSAMVPAAALTRPTALIAALGGAAALALALGAAAVLALGVWIAEGAGRRGLAVALVAVASVGGYAWLKRATFAAIDRQAGARWLWMQARQHGDSLCLGEVRRHLDYGLSYYAGRRISSCSDDPRPYRIEGDRIVLWLKP